MGFCCRKSQESGSLANFRFGVVHKGSRRQIGILNRHFADIFLVLFKNLQITYKSGRPLLMDALQKDV